MLTLRRRYWVGIGYCSLGLADVLAAGAASSTLRPPVHLTAAQDHQRMIDLLHIKYLRPGADPNNPHSPNAVNYDESKADPYPTLPNPLVLNDGKRVTTAAMWWTLRRPQIVREFNTDVYGCVPTDTPKVDWEVRGTMRGMNGSVPTITRHLVGRVDNSAYPPISVSRSLISARPARAEPRFTAGTLASGLEILPESASTTGWPGIFLEITAR